jgi:hypothetical protein
MTIDFTRINWAAVSVAALATFMLGGVWYQALFGRLWVKLHGFAPEQVAAMKAARPPAVFFGGMIAAYLVLAVVVALIVVEFDLRGAPAGLVLGLLLWLGPTSAVAFTGWLASEKPIGTFWIDASYQFIYMLMMGAILAAWR